MANQPHIAEVDEIRALQERFHDGDVEAFRRLVEPHLDNVFTLCLRMTSNRALAEDMAQDALARALTKHTHYRPGRPVRPWLLTIAANLCRSHLRSPWWKRWNPLSGREEEQFYEDPQTLSEAVDRDEKIRHALSNLDDKYREAISLFFLQDMSYAEMAEITGVSVPALKQRVRRGGPLLRKQIERLYPGLVLNRKGNKEGPG